MNTRYLRRVAPSVDPARPPRRMWRKGNTAPQTPSRPRHIAALSCGIALAAALLAAAASPATAAALDEAIARQAYAVARNWVRRAAVPDSTLPVEATGVSAVHVTIRQNGPTVGQFTAEVDSPLRDPAANADPDAAAPPAEPAVDLMPLVQKAVRGAIADATTNLKDPNELRDAPEKFQLDIQFAGPPQRVRVERLDELPGRIAVGADGLAMRRAGVFEWAFPGNMIAANADLRSQLNRLLAALSISLDQLPAIGSPDGPELYRFDVVHLAELPNGDGRVLALHRGAVTLPPTALDDAALGTLADQLTAQIVARQRSNGEFAGTYEPTADQFSPPTARDVDAALAALALARRARLPQLDDAQRKLAADAAIAALHNLSAQVPRNVALAPQGAIGSQLAPTAAALLALLEAPAGAGDYEPLRVRLAGALRGMQNPDGWFRIDANAASHDAPLGSSAVAVAAMARLYERTRDNAVLESALHGLGALHRRIDAADDMTIAQAMPWIAMAHYQLDRLAKPAANLDAFADASRKLWDQQITPWANAADAPHSPDTFGGFNTASSLLDEPTWTSSSILVGQAIALRHNTVVDREARAGWLVRCGLGARFVAQLTMQTDDLYYVRNPHHALGGVRMALWDNRQPLFSGAMSLLAITELQHSLAYLAGQVEQP